MQAPKAKKVKHVFQEHGEERIDHYHWLREKTNPEVLGYLLTENAYSKEYFEPKKKEWDSLFAELKSRIKETDESVPVQEDDYHYYHRVEKGQQYAVYCRRKGNMKAPEEVLLDVNELAKGLDYIGIGLFRVSDDHRFLAYSIDTDGSEVFRIFVKDLNTGKTLPDELPDSYYSLEWANDNRTFYYVRQNAEQRPYQLVRHVVGTPVESDTVVYQEDDGQFFVNVDKSRDGKYIFLNLEGAITTECYYFSADVAEPVLELILPREHGVEYYPTIDDGRFFLLTNKEAPNFRLASMPLSGERTLTDVIPHSVETLLEDFEFYEKYLVVFRRTNGLPEIEIRDKDTGSSHLVPFAEEAYEIESDEYGNYEDCFVRFQYSSLVTPGSVFSYHMDDQRLENLKVQEIPSGYDASLYTSERVWVESYDGTRVPVSLCYRKGIAEGAPVYLTGYGSYGISSDVYFSTSRISLLDRGYVYAIAHIRGGSELGRKWYENGKFLHKKNTFKDFIASAEYLKKRFQGDVAITGGSAGGMLMGAVINERPDLFSAVCAHVPFVDVLTTMFDKTLPLTEIEFDEWGNPEDKIYYDYIKTYSPLDNVKKQDYPAVLITSGLNDPRVTYWEPTKWAARLRDMKTDDNVLLLYTNMDAGHSGKSGRYEHLHEVVREYLFIFSILGTEL